VTAVKPDRIFDRGLAPVLDRRPTPAKNLPVKRKCLKLRFCKMTRARRNGVPK